MSTTVETPVYRDALERVIKDVVAPAASDVDASGTFPLPQAVTDYPHNASVTRNITVFNDDVTDTSVGFAWTVRTGGTPWIRG